ncbi:GAF domain-containing sensor histidine kinase [Acidithrix sp. C25]|uniref:GAF domain-containing sensor histidine kinase n=1 Tax=Acidithrix sp. C25 TaxID=1671482 RepID=UPI00191BB007|nr:GAF domain-containing sensor histidine kinase [Acidithrix sp. C25]CAG4920606.1 unnamed protein product [Acidithrix sp. C25]
MKDHLLRQIIDAMPHVTDLEELADHVAELVIGAFGADVCFVYLLDEDQRHISLIGATPPYSIHRGKIRLAVGDGISGWVAQSKIPLIVPDKWADSRYRYMPELEGENFNFLISVPMMRPGEVVVGVLNVHWRELPSESESILVDLQYVANLFAGNVEMAALVEKLARRESQLEKFAADTIDAAELERKRIARDIHDGLGQLLHSALYHLDAAMYPESMNASRIEITAAKDLVVSAISEVKETISRLRPGILDDLGLMAGLASLCNSIKNPEVDVELPEVFDAILASAAEITIYRITQEALANIIKHSGATWASLKIWLDYELRILHAIISDDGAGFDVDDVNNGHGIQGMRERVELIGASLEVFSRANHGTKIHLKVPFSLNQ